MRAVCGRVLIAERLVAFETLRERRSSLGVFLTRPESPREFKALDNLAQWNALRNEMPLGAITGMITLG